MNKIMMRLLALMVMFAAYGFANAQGTPQLTASIPAIKNAGEVVNLAIGVDNNGCEVGALQVDINLPEELEFAGEPVKNEGRLTNRHNVYFNSRTGRVMVMSMTATPFIGETGPVVYIPVTLKSGYQAGNVQSNVVLSKITISSPMGDKYNVPAEMDVPATVETWTAVVSFVPEQLVVNPGSKSSIAVAFDNNCTVAGMQFNVTLPAGIELDGELINSTRLSTTAEILYQQDKNNKQLYRMMMVDLSTNLCMEPGKGVAFTIPVKAAADFAADKAEIVISDILISVRPNVPEFSATGCTAAVINGNAAYKEATASVSALQPLLDAALARIATEAPDVKDRFTGSEIAAEISALAARVEQEYTDLTLTANLSEILAAAETIKGEIETLVSDAIAAEAAYKEAERVAANKAAYDAVVAQIEALQNKLNSTVVSVGVTYPDAEITAQKEAAQNAIDAVKAAAEEAYKAVEKEGNFNYTPDTAAIEALINAITEEAKKQYDDKAEADRVAANKAAYDAVVAGLAALQEQLDNAAAAAATDCPHADVTAEKAAAQKAIDDAKAAAEEAYKAVEKEGNFAYNLDAKAIEALISALTASAQAQEDAWKEANRAEANKAAYDAVKARLAEIASELDKAVAEAAEKYPDADVRAEEKEIRQALTAAGDKADAEYKAVAKEGNYDYTPDYEALEAMIAAYTEAARVAQEEHDDAARRAANEAAYNEVVKTLDALQNKLDATIVSVNITYPDADVAAEEEAAQKAIDDAREAALNELNDVEKEGEYDYSPDTAAIEALIQAIIEKAKQAGIGQIYADMERGAKVYGTNGLQLAAPVRNAINIIVMPDGTVKKVYVK